ncbi:MAG: hypothetical protein HN531_00810 [Opitutae bacterium]|jgi:hypothetical protein|nr:hypothetical protein [Opitutae bacterium]
MTALLLSSIFVLSISALLALFAWPGSIKARGFFSRKVELPVERSHWLVNLLIPLLFILFAYGLSVHIRYTWIDFAEAHYVTDAGEKEFFRPQMVRDGIALPNTHDSFYFGSILQKALYQKHQDNHLIPSVYTNGMITYLPYLLLKTFPDKWTIEELLLKIPVWVAGLVCIPIVLIGRLYGSSLWGFFAACLAGVAHSYYNRTLAGYYDTDMFSITVPAFAFFFLLAASRRESVGYLVAAAVTLYLSRFFYGSTQAITCAMCLVSIFYRLGIFILEALEAAFGKGRESSSSNFFFLLLGLPSLRFTCLSVVLVGWALVAESWSSGKVIEDNFLRFWLGLLVPVVLYLAVRLKRRPDEMPSFGDELSKDGDDPEPAKAEKTLPAFPLISDTVLAVPAVIVLLLLFFGVVPILNAGPFSGTWAKLTGKLQSYSSSRVAGATISGSSGYNLNFLDVKSTIREAGSLDQKSKTINDIRMRNRILEDLPLWRGDWFNDDGSASPAQPPDANKKYKWFNPFEKTFNSMEQSLPKYAGDLNLKTALLALLGYLLLCSRYWEFLLGAPFWFIGYNCFSHFVDSPLGLRFTVHVGNVASIGLVFLLLVVSWAFFRLCLSFLSKGKNDRLKKILKIVFKSASLVSVGVVVVLFAWPNVDHAKGYHSHVVYPVKTIEVLEELNQASDPDDFVVTWWDYGSGCWFYGDTRTFTSPAHQTLDNYLTSEILRANSHLQAANLARLKTETFVRLQDEKKSGQAVYYTAVQEIFKDGSSDLVFYQGLLDEMNDANASLPAKSRDVFLFMPYEILRIFPTILSFSSRNLYFPSSSVSSRKEVPMKILRNGRRQGNTLFFEGGHRMDRKGVLKLVDAEKSFVLPYGKMLTVGEDGQPAETVDQIDVDGLRIPANASKGINRVIVFVQNKNELIILSPKTYRSTFAKRFILDRFDATAYANPLFAQSANPRSSPFFLKADGVRILNGGTKIVLRAGGGYQIEADLRTNLAKMPNVKDPLPFSFHRRLHDKKTGEVSKTASAGAKDSKFHIIQTNLPRFTGQPTHVVSTETQSLSAIALTYGLDPDVLSRFMGKDRDHQFVKGEVIKIPSKGYDLFQAWFFMDDKAFNSLLIQGFLMEDLDPSLYEKVASSPWGKVYKILK